MSEYVSDCCLMPTQQIFQLYHGENKLIFNEMMMSALYKTNTLSQICIVLAHWNNSPRVDMFPHSNTLSWLRANQSLLFFLNAVCKSEEHNANFIIFGLTRSGLEPTISRTWGEYANHYTTDVDWIER